MRTSVLAFVLVSALAFPASGTAEPLVLLSSSVISPWTGDPFSARLVADGVDLRAFTLDTGMAERLYQPGQTVPLEYSTRLDVALSGSFTGPGLVDFRFSGPPFTLPPGPISTTDYVDLPYRVPFSFEGEVVGFGAVNAVLYRQMFVGTGTALFTVTSYPYSPIGYVHDAFVFQFDDPAAVPEPATWLLVSAGALLVRARRVRSAR